MTQNQLKLYDDLEKSINEAAKRFFSMPPMTCEELQGLRQGILEAINCFQEEKLKPAIQELKDNQEWDKFTIAFYGETGAGKSTIIESLRIKFEEPTKKQQQSNFLKAKSSFFLFFCEES